MPNDHSELAAAELADATIAEFATDIFDDHVRRCPRCTDEKLCLTGAELRLIKIEANEDVLEDGSDVTADAMAKAWGDLRAAAETERDWAARCAGMRGERDAERQIAQEWESRLERREQSISEGITKIRKALEPLGIFGNSNDPDLLAAVIGGYVESAKAEEGALQEALDALGRAEERHQAEKEALYTERTRLAVALAGLCRILGQDAGMRDDPAATAPWKRVLLLDFPDMPAGEFQASWHIAEKDLALVAHLPEFPRPWNGHTTAEKYDRLQRAAIAMGAQEITPEQQAELRLACEGERRQLLRFREAFKEGLLARERERAEFERRIDSLHGDISKLRDSLTQMHRASKDAAAAVLEPIPMRLACEGCGNLHVDEGEFETKPHHTHACQYCGLVWRPALRFTVGVRFLPGFKNEEKGEVAP